MALDKAIEHQKEWRRQYWDSRRFDRACRTQGRCDYCRKNRTHANLKARIVADERLKEWKEAK